MQRFARLALFGVLGGAVAANASWTGPRASTSTPSGPGGWADAAVAETAPPSRL